MASTHDVVRPLQGLAGLGHGHADGRVGDGVQIGPGRIVGEGHGGQSGTVDGAVGGHDARAEAIDQRLIGRTAGGDDVAGHLVGIDEHGPAGHQQIGHGRLARPDAPGEADCQHQAAGAGAGLGERATAKRTSVVSSSSSVTNQSSAVIPVAPPASPRATSL